MDDLCACGESVGDANTFSPWKLNIRQNRLFKDFLDASVVWDSRRETVCVLCAYSLRITVPSLLPSHPYQNDRVEIAILFLVLAVTLK